jgi:hypothetical protein
MSSRKAIAIVLTVLALSFSCSKQASDSQKALPVGLEEPEHSELDYKTQWHWLFQKSASEELTKEELEIIEKITNKATKKSNSQELPKLKDFDILNTKDQ